MCIINVQNVITKYYRCWNVMWESNGTKIFKKPENDQYVNGNMSLIFILLFINRSLKSFKRKLRLFTFNIKCRKKNFYIY